MSAPIKPIAASAKRTDPRGISSGPPTAVFGGLEQVGVVIVSLMSVTLPFRASARPLSVTPLSMVIEVSAMMVPTKVEPDPSDLYLCAARLLLLVDVGSWPGVTRLHVDTKGLYAPSLDLACQFHRIAPGVTPLFVRGESPSGADGLLGTHQQVWSPDRELLASGVSQLLCRPSG